MFHYSRKKVSIGNRIHIRTALAMFLVVFFIIEKCPRYQRIDDIIKMEVSEGLSDEWKQQLLDRLNTVKEACGELCQLTNGDEIKSHISKEDGVLRVPIQCKALFELHEADASDINAPNYPPQELIPFYSLNGLVQINKRDPSPSRYLDVATRNWPETYIEEQVQLALNRSIEGTYGTFMSNKIIDMLKDVNIQNKSILVIGSQNAWIEAILISLGAFHVTTLEYARIKTNHSKLSSMVPSDFREQYIANKLDLFDGVVSISSLEHSGLGRYGDALNPWSDLISVARAWCVTKPGGFFLINVPAGPKDSIEYHLHRIYGPVRWPLLTANWKSTTLLPSQTTVLHNAILTKV